MFLPFVECERSLADLPPSSACVAISSIARGILAVSTLSRLYFDTVTTFLRYIFLVLTVRSHLDNVKSDISKVLPPPARAIRARGSSGIGFGIAMASIAAGNRVILIARGEGHLREEISHGR